MAACIFIHLYTPIINTDVRLSAAACSHTATGSLMALPPPARVQNFTVFCTRFPTLFPGSELQGTFGISPDTTVDDIKARCSQFVWDHHRFWLPRGRFALVLHEPPVGYPTPFNCPLWFLPQSLMWRGLATWGLRHPRLGLGPETH